jgi:hypothetical protein
MVKIRSAAKDRAYRIGRAARILGLDVKEANVDLAHKLGWSTRADFDNDLLDECERGWHAQDELMETHD